jgi:hypothetical protein
MENRRPAKCGAGFFRIMLLPVATAMIVAAAQRGAMIYLPPPHFDLLSSYWLTRASGSFVNTRPKSIVLDGD